MYDGMDIRPEPVDSPVHRELGRGIALIAAQLAAIDVDQDKHLFGHAAFADHRRGGNYCAVVEPPAYVSVRGRDEAALVNLAAYLNNLLSQLSLVLHLIDHRLRAGLLDRNVAAR